MQHIAKILSSKAVTSTFEVATIRYPTHPDVNWIKFFCILHKNDLYVSKGKSFPFCIAYIFFDTLSNKSKENKSEWLFWVSGDKEVDVKVTGVRPAYDHTVNASVRMPVAIGKKLVDAGRIRIGWVQYRVSQHT